MTVLRPGSKIQREISIPGLDKPIQIEITHTGIYFWVKGTRKRSWSTWTQAIESGTTPGSVPSFLMGRPLELLRYQAGKHTE